MKINRLLVDSSTIAYEFHLFEFQSRFECGVPKNFAILINISSSFIFKEVYLTIVFLFYPIIPNSMKRNDFKYRHGYGNRNPVAHVLKVKKSASPSLSAYNFYGGKYNHIHQYLSTEILFLRQTPTLYQLS